MPYLPQNKVEVALQVFCVSSEARIIFDDFIWTSVNFKYLKRMFADSLSHLEVANLEEMISNKLQGKRVIAIRFETCFNMGGNTLFSLSVGFRSNLGLLFYDSKCRVSKRVSWLEL
jgi:hypothetical protein